MPSASETIIAPIRVDRPADGAQDADLARALEHRHRHRVRHADPADDQGEDRDDPAGRDDQPARRVDLDRLARLGDRGDAREALLQARRATVFTFWPSLTLTPIDVTSPGASRAPRRVRAAARSRGPRSGRRSGRRRDRERRGRRARMTRRRARREWSPASTGPRTPCDDDEAAVGELGRVEPEHERARPRRAASPSPPPRPRDRARPPRRATPAAASA